MRRVLIPITLLVLAVASPALAQECAPGGRATEATCGGDVCACSMNCVESVNCLSDCCVDGFCVPSCVCAGEGTVILDCSTGIGCGLVVAPTSTPAAPLSLFWGVSLLGLGLVGGARSLRRGGVRTPATVAALSVCLLGAAMVTARAFEEPHVPASKALKAR